MSTHVLAYPGHFNSACAAVASSTVTLSFSAPDLVATNVLWLIPALPLIWLGRKAYVNAVYFVVTLLFAVTIGILVVGDFTEEIYCLKRINAGGMVVLVLLILQAILLLGFSAIVALVHGGLALSRRPRGSDANVN
ncbi:MAG: hypothetical protein P4M07_02580 [Xanthobacteraceae bacterium]|nr:hypothetical protein [Xanthobacteraceae bacterium]